jgi:hypothetical protein
MYGQYLAPLEDVLKVMIDVLNISYPTLTQTDVLGKELNLSYFPPFTRGD